MDQAPVASIKAKVLEELEAKGASDVTLKRYRGLFSSLEKFCDGGVYTASSGEAFAAETGSRKYPAFSARHRRDRRRVVRIADRFLDGDFPCTEDGAIGGAGNEPQTPESAELIEALEAYMEERGFSWKTRYDYRYMAGIFLAYLESLGCAFADAGPDSISGFIAYLRQRGSASPKCLVVSHLRPLLRAAGRDDLFMATSMVGASAHHPVRISLGDEDAEALAQACVERRVDSRCAAMTLLALTTGLRGVDILGIELAGVNWREMTLGVTQSKTGNHVRVPLLPAVAAALADYVVDERPPTGSTRLFVSKRPPHGPLVNSSVVGAAVEEAYAAAGIEGVPAGTRALRHTAASRLMRAGTPMPTISAVLGHASPASTEPYLEADDERMLACVLPLPKGASS